MQATNDIWRKIWLKSLRSENHTPRFHFLIEELGPISCKNLNKFSKKMSQKPISLKPRNSAYSIRHDYAGQSVPQKG